MHQYYYRFCKISLEKGYNIMLFAEESMEDILNLFCE